MGLWQLPTLLFLLVVIWDVKSSVAGVANGSIVVVDLTEIKSPSRRTQKKLATPELGDTITHNFCVKWTNLIRRATRVSST